ncbi:unnamed protein product [Chironomus riparius]|uniref:Protein sleepless n=1 Tax=Chironomus riparius TaxID=315576 RepID=A0A9N9WWP9_9DIPT|nr:unnamed protein product [Chironomus riparius]
MKSFAVILIVLMSLLVKMSNGHMCYECNSFNDTNCFDLSPQSNVFVGVRCESTERVHKTCYSAHISEHKKRKMIRGCKNVGICDELEKREQSDIFFKVLACGECTEHYCNKSSHLSAISIITILLLSCCVHFLSII